MTPPKGTRECDKCLKNRQLRFFKPAGRRCFTCQKRRTKVVSHEARVVATYGLEPGEYAALNAAQDGKCAGCGQARSYNLNVDHDHKVEAELGARASIRGLLCRRCNKVLAVVGDNAMLLLNLMSYLDMWPSARVLGEDVQGWTVR